MCLQIVWLHLLAQWTPVFGHLAGGNRLPGKVVTASKPFERSIRLRRYRQAPESYPPSTFNLRMPVQRRKNPEPSRFDDQAGPAGLVEFGSNSKLRSGISQTRDDNPQQPGSQEAVA